MSGGGNQRGYPRSHRVGDFIQRELAELIRTEVKDPRVSPMLTVSAVDVSRDLSVATVHWTTLDRDDAAKRDTQDALESAAAFLRRRLAPLINIRAVPQLRFRHDDSTERGARMSALIEEAVASNTTAADAVAAADQTVSDPLAERVADPRADPRADVRTDVRADPDRRIDTDPLAGD